MSNTNGWLVAFFVIASLIVGIAAGSMIFPTENTIIVEKRVNVPVEVVKEVPKEIVKIIEKEVPSGDSILALLEKAKIEFMAEVEDDDDLQICGDVSYDYDQIEIKKVYDNWAVSYKTSSKDNVTSVDFVAKVKYSDADFEDKCYDDKNVSVVFHSNPNKDTKVTVA